MILENMSKEEIITILKPYLLKCNKDINLKDIQFTKGHCYLFNQNEGGNWLKDNNDNWIDLDELSYTHHIKGAFQEYI